MTDQRSFWRAARPKAACTAGVRAAACSAALVAGFAAAGPLLAAPPVAGPRDSAEIAGGASAIAAAFREICLDTDFSPAAVEAAFAGRGWHGTIVQRPSARAPFTHWTFPFGELQVGYHMIGGSELRQYSCALVLHASAAPLPADLVEALSALLETPLRRRDEHAGSAYRYVARLADRPDHQGSVIVTGDQVPFSRGNSIGLGPGILVSYDLARGAHARNAIGANVQ